MSALRGRVATSPNTSAGSIILALIAILVIVALKFLQPQISNTLNKVSNNL